MTVVATQPQAHGVSPRLLLPAASPTACLQSSRRKRSWVVISVIATVVLVFATDSWIGQNTPEIQIDDVFIHTEHNDGENGGIDRAAKVVVQRKKNVKVDFSLPSTGKQDDELSKKETTSTSLPPANKIEVDSSDASTLDDDDDSLSHQPTNSASSEGEDNHNDTSSDVACPTIRPQDDCNLDDPDGGIPVIFVSIGILEKTQTWDTLAALVSHKNGNYSQPTTPVQPALYGLGVGVKGMLEEIEREQDEDGECWIRRKLCEIKHKYPQSQVFGTLWTAYTAVMKHRKIKEAMAWLAKCPNIKVVYYQRNQIENVLERRRAVTKNNINNLTLPADFSVNAFKSLERQDQIIRDVLEGATNDDEKIKNSYNGPYLTVSYERLYFQPNATEWQRLLDFVTNGALVSKPGRPRLNLHFVKLHASEWPLPPKPLEQRISNYDMLASSLRGTPYESYLTMSKEVHAFHDKEVIDFDEMDCYGSNQEQKCDLRERELGIPTILITFGRSGSSVTWDTVASLASDGHGQKGVEATGSGAGQSMKVLTRYPYEHGKCWLERILCDLQGANRRKKENRKKISTIYGTKWKVAGGPFSHRKTLEALQWVAANPHIKIIHLTRNMLDVTISRYKHETHTTLNAHCVREDCAEQQIVRNMILPLNYLWTSLRGMKDSLRVVAQQLNVSGASHVDVTYEQLYYASNANEWMRIFDFVGLESLSHNLTLQAVQERTKLKATHPENRTESLANHDEIVEALRGTEFEDLLLPLF